MIVGLGIDVCSVERIRDACARPGFVERVFTPTERDGSDQSRAGRFAAKEAFAKALGAPAGLRWADCEVRTDAAGLPSLVAVGTVAARMAALGVTSLHVSISHDAGVAAAVVVCEGPGSHAQA